MNNTDMGQEMTFADSKSDSHRGNQAKAIRGL